MPAHDLPVLINPKSVIPYSVRFSSPPAKWSKLDVKVTAPEATDLDLNFAYADFETAQTGIELPTSAESLKPVKVTGTVKNTGSKNARDIKIAVAFFYDDGRVADVVATGPAQGKLAPGESSEFEAESLFATFEQKPVTKIVAVASAMPDE